MESSRFKFRAWHSHDKVMYSAHTVDFSCSPLLTIWPWPEDVDATVAIHADELMQYTGLEDKNGVEIYEGDILKVINESYSREGELMPVSFGEYSDSEDYMDEMHYGYNIRGMPLVNCIKDGSIVVGNIHQHKELLGD